MHIHTYDLNLSDGILENYRKSGPLLKTIAFLKNTDESSVAHEIFENQFYEDLSTYVNLGQIIKSKKSIREGFPEYKSVDAKAFSDLLLKTLPSYHISDEAVTLYKSIGWDVFSSLSKDFGISILSFDDADAQIIKAWDAEKNKAIIESIDKKIAERRAAVKRDSDKLAKIKGEDAITWVMLIFTAFLIPIALTDGVWGFLGKIVVLICGMSFVLSLCTVKPNKKSLKKGIEIATQEISALEYEKAQYL